MRDGPRSNPPFIRLRAAPLTPFGGANTQQSLPRLICGNDSKGEDGLMSVMMRRRARQLAEEHGYPLIVDSHLLAVYYLPDSHTLIGLGGYDWDMIRENDPRYVALSGPVQYVAGWYYETHHRTATGERGWRRTIILRDDQGYIAADVGPYGGHCVARITEERALELLNTAVNAAEKRQLTLHPTTAAMMVRSERRPDE